MRPAVRRFGVLVTAVVALGTPAAGSEAVCDPGVEAEAVLRQVRDLDETCGPADACRQRMRALLEAALERNPLDVFLHREYQDALRPAPGALAAANQEFLDSYRSRHLAEPERPLWLYLYGRARSLVERVAQPDLFERALESDSRFAWAHLSLLHGYVSHPRLEDTDNAQKHVDAFMRLCPDAPEVFTHTVTDGGAFERSGVAGLRTLLERRLDARTLPHFETLWRAEFRLTPPAEHQVVRGRIRGDIERLRAAPMRETFLWWETLTQAYPLVGDERALESAQREMVERFPCVEHAARAREELWSVDHPWPDSPAGRSTWKRTLFEASQSWVKACPETFSYRWTRFAMTPDDLSDGELAAVVAEFLAYWEVSGRKGRFSTSPYLMAAEALVERGMWLDRIDEFTTKGLEEAEARRVRQSAQAQLSSAEPSEIDSAFAMQEWQAQSIRARAALKRATPDTAAPSLAKLEALLETLRPGDDAAPRQKTSHRARQAELEELRGQLALARGGRAVAPWIPDRSLESAAPSSWEVTHRPLPDFRLDDLTARTWTRADIGGEVAFVNVWATWCGPCIAELPFVQRLHERLKDRPDVTLLTLNVDDNPGLVGPFVESRGYRFPSLQGTDWFFRNRWSPSIPQSWLIDRGGIIRYEQGSFDVGVGETWLADVLEKVERLAAEAGEPSGAAQPH
jgi:thiol-disulfide isomerase/thioredoxin